MTERLYNDPDLASFYDIENTWDCDFDFCQELATDADSVLDLGCGTGELAVALATGRDVVGVDPARAMLDHAARRPGAASVHWVEGDARGVTLDRHFDLVLLTGHAFQVFLTEADQLRALSTIRRHLSPGGHFLFDTRNALCRAWETWQADETRTIEHPRFGPVTVWTETTFDAERHVATYVKHYRIAQSGRILRAPSRIRFDTRSHIERLLDQAGLVVDTWYGNWAGDPWHRGSPEIIPFGRAVAAAPDGVP